VSIGDGGRIVLFKGLTGQLRRIYDVMTPTHLNWGKGTITMQHAIEPIRERTRVFMSVRVIHVSQSEQSGYPWWTGGQVTFWHTRVNEFELKERIRAGMRLFENTKNERTGRMCAAAAGEVAGRTRWLPVDDHFFAIVFWMGVGSDGCRMAAETNQLFYVAVSILYVAQGSSAY
jgi:hypothetical protein